MEHSEVTVIICTYNRAKMLHDSLCSLVDQEKDCRFSYDILVVDDASTDDTVGCVKKMMEKYPGIISYTLAQGKGIAAARNVGIKYSSGDWIAFFDDDQLASKSWLKRLYDCAVEVNGVCVGGRRLLHLSEERMNGLSHTIRALLGEIDIYETIKKCRRKEFPAAGNLLLKRSVLGTIGNFEEALICGGEDIILAQKMRSAGFGAWYTPSALVKHIVPDYRLEENYLKIVSQRAGDAFAYRDYLEWGFARTALAAFARLCQAAFVFCPKLIIGWIRKEKSILLTQKCLIWRSGCYFRKTLDLAFPGHFLKKKFYDRLNFRKERKIFKIDSNPIKKVRDIDEDSSGS